MHIQEKYTFLIMCAFTNLGYKINPKQEKLTECCVRILARQVSALRLRLSGTSAGYSGVVGARYGRGRGGKRGERLEVNVFLCGGSAGTLRCLRPRRRSWKAGA